MRSVRVQHNDLRRWLCSHLLWQSSGFPWSAAWSSMLPSRLVRAGDTVKTAIQKLNAAWPGHALSSTQVRFWFRRFTEVPDRNVKDDKHTGRHRSKRTPDGAQQLEGQLQNEKRMTLRQLAVECGMSKRTAHRIIRKDLNMRKLAPKFVLKILTPHQLQTRLDLCTTNLRTLDQDPGLLSRLIATDESWVFTYDPRTKFADMEWTCPGEPRPKKVLRSRSQCKTLLILYFDSHGTIYCFFYDDGTVDSEVYIQSLREMREALRRKHRQLWRDQNFFLLQDNASLHTCVDTAAYLFEVDMAERLWPHPQYSPDLSPCDYWAFPILKSKIRGHRFQTLEDVKTTVHRTLRDIPLAEYQNCFDQLAVWYRKCIAAAGHYFEGQGNRGIAHPQ